MTQTPALIKTLKQQLKAHGKTYADVATTLQISEASVKRLFASNSFSLQRLEHVCQLIDLQLTELILLMEKSQPQLQQLTTAQEKDIVNDPLLLLITVSVINGHSYHELLNDINITEPELIQKLAQLDRLHIIDLLPNNRIKLLVAPNFKWLSNGPIQQYFQQHVEQAFFNTTFAKPGEKLAQLDRLHIIDLLPNNRIKLLVAPNFKWLSNGPIQQYFQQHVEQAFFNTTFAKPGEKLLVLNGSLSQESNKQLQRMLDKLAREFNELMQKDHALPSHERFNNTLVLAARDWHYGLFEEYKKG